jgi:hypothetical protein
MESNIKATTIVNELLPSINFIIDIVPKLINKYDNIKTSRLIRSFSKTKEENFDDLRDLFNTLYTLRNSESTIKKYLSQKQKAGMPSKLHNLGDLVLVSANDIKRNFENLLSLKNDLKKSTNTKIKLGFIQFKKSVFDTLENKVSILKDRLKEFIKYFNEKLKESNIKPIYTQTLDQMISNAKKLEEATTKSLYKFDQKELEKELAKQMENISLK